MTNIVGQDEILREVSRIIEIFTSSQCKIRPHFILTGPSGSGKSLTIQALANKFKIAFVPINAAQLTKEGTSGNSLSKALTPLLQFGGKPVIVFADEFDKLFISGNSNDSHAHETTTGVQNEFLKVLESDVSSVYGDYGKYVNANTGNVLFIFAGAFNNEPNLNIDRLRAMGVKTEFLGRVGLVYNTKQLTTDDLLKILEESPLLEEYLRLFDRINKDTVVRTISSFIIKYHANNTLGARLVNTLINQYFIKGGVLEAEEVKEIVFQKKLSLDFQN